MLRLNRIKPFVGAFLKRSFRGTPPQDVGSPLQDVGSPLQDVGSPLKDARSAFPNFTSYHKVGSPLQDDGLYYKDFGKVMDAMWLMDNDLLMGRDVETQRVNSALRDILSTQNYSFVHRILYYIDKKQIQPDEETFGIMMNIYDERKEFVEVISIMKKVKEYNLLPTAEMYNFTIGGYFQMGDYKHGWVMYAQMIISSRIKPTSDTFCLFIRHCTKTEGDIEKYLNMMQQQGVQPTLDTLGEAIDAFLMIGSIEKAKKVLLSTKLPESCLNEAKGTLVSSLADFRYVDDAFEIYREIKSGKHHPLPTATLALIENITDHDISFDELLADLRDYHNWDEACANIILWCILNQKITLFSMYVQMRAMAWPKGNLCEMIHFLDKAIHNLEHKVTQFGALVIKETTRLPSCTPSRRGLDCFQSICYRRKLWVYLKWVLQHYEKCDLQPNVMNDLSTFKAMLACGETEIAKDISSNMDAAHNDHYLKDLFDKNITTVKRGYQDTFIETEEYALRHVF